MEIIDLAIVTWHQTYLSSYAGGYVRIRKFLQRFPKEITYKILDNKKSIYADIVSKDTFIEYQSPQWIENLQKKIFILWFFLETISSTIILYKSASKLIRQNEVKVLYFPTGEFLQLYIVSFLIKKRFRQVKIILDILNYGILDESYSVYFQRLRKNKTGLLRAIVITITIYSSHVLMKHTIKHADYIFTVSSDFVKKIKKDYQKETIDFTPSGVDLPSTKKSLKEKKYTGIYVGRMTLEKGIFDLISIWSEVIKTLPRAKLGLAGYADSVVADALKKEIDERKLGNNIEIIGDVTDKRKWELLNDSEIFLHFARREPLFPVITILEGFSYGLPAFIYDMQVYKSAVKEFDLSLDSIIVTKNGDIKKAAQNIIAYNKYDKTKKKNLSESAFNNAKLFSWDKIAQKEFKIIQSLIAHS